MTAKTAEAAINISLNRIEKKLDRIAESLDRTVESLEQFAKFVLEVTPDAAIADVRNLTEEIESIE
jgi:hypothetical protein